MNSSIRTSIVGGNDEESAVADVAQTREYVLAYTNATSIVTPEFRDTEELDGLFVGYDAERRAYDPERMHWNYAANAPQPSTHPAPDGTTMPYCALLADISTAAAEKDGTLLRCRQGLAAVARKRGWHDPLHGKSRRFRRYGYRTLRPRTMEKAMTSTALLRFTALFALTCAPAFAQQTPPANPDADKEDWIVLFNGKDLKGWTPKIAKHEIGENFGDTFRVEDGLLKVRYDKYTSFDGQFGHLFYTDPFSYYKLRVEYRFVGQQAPGNPGAWALRNSGVMLHSQDPRTMPRDQTFPISIEGQLLGGNSDGKPRATANMCSPGTEIVYQGKLYPEHCLSSTSPTFDGEQWVQAVFEVHGSGTISHFVNGQKVLEYELPQYGGGVVDNYDTTTKLDGQLIEGGYIALQSESHPIDFRRVELLNLAGCMDRNATNYKSYYLKNVPESCTFAEGAKPAMRRPGEYPLMPNSLQQANVPRGKLDGPFEFHSRIIAGTVRRYWVWVPAQYNPKVPANVLVFQDGQRATNPEGSLRVPQVMENLIAQKKMPVTIGIFITPGNLSEAYPTDLGMMNPNHRREEYDALDDTYARFLIEEMLPEVGKTYNLTNDPEKRVIGGTSSGAICAFTVAWQRPDYFRHVISMIGSYTSIGYEPAANGKPMKPGGDLYPTLIRKNPIKPIRIFLQDGSHDLSNEHGNWFLANQQMLSAFEYANANADKNGTLGPRYEVRYSWGDGAHSDVHGGTLLPEILEWIWKP